MNHVTLYEGKVEKDAPPDQETPAALPGKPAHPSLGGTSPRLSRSHPHPPLLPAEKHSASQARWHPPPMATLACGYEQKGLWSDGAELPFCSPTLTTMLRM
jgi:hypothetical protein